MGLLLLILLIVLLLGGGGYGYSRYGYGGGRPDPEIADRFCAVRIRKVLTRRPIFLSPAPGTALSCY